MGRSRKKKGARSASTTNARRTNHLQSHPLPYDEELPRVSLDEVKLLLMAPDRIWKVVVSQKEGDDKINDEKTMVIRVMDMTNEVFPPHSNAVARSMIVRPIPVVNGIPSQEEALNVILNGMKNHPSRPRRPRFLLLDPKLKSIFLYIKNRIETLSVPVRLCSDITYTESAFAVEQHQYNIQHSTSGRGLSTATAAVVRLLPQDPKETWKIFVYEHEDSRTGFILVVENHTDKKGKTMVGNGETGLVSTGQGILATMLSPVKRQKRWE